VGSRRAIVRLGAAAALAMAGGAASAHDPGMQHDAMQHDHAAHAAMLAKPSAFKRSRHEYSLPDIALRDQSGRTVPLRELQREGPLAVNFIFTTCTTICPVMSATFSQMLFALGPDAERIHLVSITIDPEHDSPAVLAEYARRFDAPPGWSFLTGNPDDVERALRAFDAWPGAKANHRPITLLRARGAHEWVRLEGLGSGSKLADEARRVIN
jgi:protein SCO1/2